MLNTSVVSASSVREMNRYTPYDVGSVKSEVCSDKHLCGPRVLCARNELKMENAEYLRAPRVLCARNELTMENAEYPCAPRVLCAR